MWREGEGRGEERMRGGGGGEVKERIRWGGGKGGVRGDGEEGGCEGREKRRRKERGGGKRRGEERIKGDRLFIPSGLIAPLIAFEVLERKEILHVSSKTVLAPGKRSLVTGCRKVC